jgi:hypothetical protein
MDTIKTWGDKLKRQHRPADLLALPDFMKPKVAKPPPAAAQVAASPVAQPAAADASFAKKLICVHCREKITFSEGKFCWNNAKRFDGLQYCREHQGLFA